MTSPKDSFETPIGYSTETNSLANSLRYSFFDPAYLITIQQRQKAMVHYLRKEGIESLHDKMILEVGCGTSRVLVEYLSMGAHQSRLVGIDIKHNSLQEAQKRLSGTHFVCANTEALPLLANYFDLILQYTMFSSILDSDIRARAVSEMLRVFKPDGLIVWYDFWTNPTNKQTRGIRPTDIRKLFPGCTFRFRKITLAPPITRLLVPHFSALAYFLEALTIFNSHYLVIIRKQNQQTDGALKSTGWHKPCNIKKSNRLDRKLKASSGSSACYNRISLESNSANRECLGA